MNYKFLKSLIIIICLINLIFSMLIILLNDLGLKNNLYTLSGFAISLFLIFLLIRNSPWGYFGLILFYGVQIIDSEFIFDNFRYGLIFKEEYSINLNNSELLVSFNFTAIILVILGVLGYINANKNSKKTIL